nr:zinc finger C2H2-type/integrase DNA-binding domain-containing protein [Tanacetum cinerariifolium]
KNLIKVFIRSSKAQPVTFVVKNNNDFNKRNNSNRGPNQNLVCMWVLTSWTPTNPSMRFVVCVNRSKPGKKKCGYWEWYDPEIDHDWYRMHVYEMYIILNPNHRNLLHNEINRQARIEELKGELFENGA